MTRQTEFETDVTGLDWMASDGSFAHSVVGTSSWQLLSLAHATDAGTWAGVIMIDSAGHVVWYRNFNVGSGFLSWDQVTARFLPCDDAPPAPVVALEEGCPPCPSCVNPSSPLVTSSSFSTNPLRNESPSRARAARQFGVSHDHALAVLALSLSDGDMCDGGTIDCSMLLTVDPGGDILDSYRQKCYDDAINYNALHHECRVWDRTKVSRRDHRFALGGTRGAGRGRSTRRAMWRKNTESMI